MIAIFEDTHSIKVNSFKEEYDFYFFYFNHQVEERHARVYKMKLARKQYMKTSQETQFALDKMEDNARQVAERMAKLQATMGAGIKGI